MQDMTILEWRHALSDVLNEDLPDMREQDGFDRDACRRFIDAALAITSTRHAVSDIVGKAELYNNITLEVVDRTTRSGLSPLAARSVCSSVLTSIDGYNPDLDAAAQSQAYRKRYMWQAIMVETLIAKAGKTMVLAS